MPSTAVTGMTSRIDEQTNTSSAPSSRSSGKTPSSTGAVGDLDHRGPRHSGEDRQLERRRHQAVALAPEDVRGRSLEHGSVVRDEERVVGSGGDRCVLRAHVLGVAHGLRAREGAGRPADDGQPQAARAERLRARGRSGRRSRRAFVPSSRAAARGRSRRRTRRSRRRRGAGTRPRREAAGARARPRRRSARGARRAGTAGRRRHEPSRRPSARAAAPRRRRRTPARADRPARVPPTATAETSIRRGPAGDAPSPTTPRSRPRPRSPTRCHRRPRGGSLSSTTAKVRIVSARSRSPFA